jgi:sortase B
MSLWESLRARLQRNGQYETDVEDEFTLTRESEFNYDRDPFLHSLSELTPEDIQLSRAPKERTKKDKTMDIVRHVMLAACVLVIVGSCVMLVDNLIQKEKGNALYDEAAKEFASAGLNFGFEEETITEDGGGIARLRQGRRDNGVLTLGEAMAQLDASASGPVSSPKSEYNEQLEKLRAVLRSYKEHNEDVYGYISIPAVGLEYVVVQGEDNDYYLNHNYKKESLVIGSIFVDYRCDESITKNFNTVLYGHNIETNGGAMFNRVTDFLKKDVFDNALIYMYTMDGVYIYQAFSVYSTKPDSGYIRTGFTSYDDFAEFAAKMKARSRIKNNVEVSGNDRIITLSTCTNYNDGRYALHAVLVDYIT